MAEKKTKRRRQQRTHSGEPTYVRRLTAFLERIKDWEDFEGGVATVETREKQADLATAVNGIFSEGGLLELGPEEIRDFRLPEVCWLWKGNTENGQPRMRVAGEFVVVARWMFTKVYGPLPPRTVVRRRCGALRCIRPHHLDLKPRNAPAQVANAKRRAQARKRAGGTQ